MRLLIVGIPAVVLPLALFACGSKTGGSGGASTSSSSTSTGGGGGGGGGNGSSTSSSSSTGSTSSSTSTSSTSTTSSSSGSSCSASGDSCAADSDCCSGLTCQSGACASPLTCAASGSSCSVNSDCCSGLTCQSGACASPPTCAASGSACSTTVDCCIGLACQSGACVTPPSGGTFIIDGKTVICDAPQSQITNGLYDLILGHCSGDATVSYVSVFVPIATGSYACSATEAQFVITDPSNHSDFGVTCTISIQNPFSTTVPITGNIAGGVLTTGVHSTLTGIFSVPAP